jgi:hypothetical protein
MRSAVVTIVSGRHDHLLRQLEGLAAGSIQPDHHIVVSMSKAFSRASTGSSASAQIGVTR